MFNPFSSSAPFGLKCTSPRIALSAIAFGVVACSGGDNTSNNLSDTGSSNAPPTGPDLSSANTASETDIIYANGMLEVGNKNLLLDIYQPSGPCTDLRPFMVVIHGGAFIGGTRKAPSLINIADLLNAEGIVAISISYRLTGDDPVVSEELRPFQEDLQAAGRAQNASDSELVQLNAAAAAVQDTVAAIRWADMNSMNRCLDIENYGLLGSSAGAVTSLHVAYNMDEYSVFRPEPKVTLDFWGRLLLRGIFSEDDAPLMIYHGTSDATVAYQEALNIQDDAEAIGLPYSFYTAQGGGHGFGVTDPANYEINGEDPNTVIIDFIKAHLTDGSPTYEVQTLIRK